MCFKHKNNTLNEKDLKNIVKLKKISTIKDFRFGTFPSISGSGSGYTFYRPPSNLPYRVVGPCKALYLCKRLDFTRFL